MSKVNREVVYNKYGGRCAYCGCTLTDKWQVDHIEPVYRTWKDEDQFKRLIKKDRGTDDISNLNPSCPRCNKWKSTFSLEQFREEIGKQVERLKRDSSAFRMALDYNLVRENKNKVVFYFETLPLGMLIYLDFVYESDKTEK